MTPNVLIDELCDRYKSLSDVQIIQIHTHGEAKYMSKPYSDSFKLISCFVGDNVREGVHSNNGDYIPIFLSEIHLLFRKNLFPLDVAFIQVSPPDKHGYCSLGTSVDITLPAIQTAKTVIALVNPQVPRTHGDGIIHASSIDFAVKINTPIHTSKQGKPTII
jgi:acyl-CoA hydrolase